MDSMADTSGQRVFLLWALDYKDGSASERPRSLPFWVSLLNNYALVHMWKITKIPCLGLHPVHLQNHLQLGLPKADLPIKYHGRTTRQGGMSPLPPRPPLVSQSKYFSLFSNPDSCKNSSIIILLIIIYKNRSSFSSFLSFSKCIFSKQRDLLFGNSVIFSLEFRVIRKANPSLPRPISLNPSEERHYVLFAIQNKNNVFFSTSALPGLWDPI